MSSPRIVLATRNQDKLREVREILHCHSERRDSSHWRAQNDRSHPEARPKDLPIDILSLLDFPDGPDAIEDGKSFLENAKKKALAGYQCSGLITIGEDSGIEIDALGGQPGIYSARYAGENKDSTANNQKVLTEMKDIPWGKRTARFVCVAVLVKPGQVTETFKGVCEGLIASKPCGNGGFGYDPIFYVPKYAKTMAELSSAEKNNISHRGKAFTQIREYLRDKMNYC